MKASFKRFVSLLLVLVMVIGVVPGISAAATQGEVGSSSTSNDSPTETTKPEATGSENTEDEAVPGETTAPGADEQEDDVYWLDAIDKGESALNVVYDEYFTEEQLERMPSVFGVDSWHGNHAQACNIWLTGKTLSFTWDGKTQTKDSIALHRLYNSDTGNWEVAFCIEPGIPNAESGYDNGEYSGDAAWGRISKDKQYAIGLAVLYGAPNNPYFDTSDVLSQLAYELATYVIIHEISLGWRNSTAPYACTNTSYIDTFGTGYLIVTSTFIPEVNNTYLRTDEWSGGIWDEVMEAYNYISDKMAKHNTIPSFANRYASQAPTYPLTDNGNGTYSATLTDTNNILSEYSFTNTSDLTFSVSGNQLTVTATGEGPYKAIAPTRILPNITSGGSLFRIWKTSAGDQEMISVASSKSDPVPAYFNLGLDTGTITGTKTTEDGQNKGNWEMERVQ